MSGQFREFARASRTGFDGREGRRSQLQNAAVGFLIALAAGLLVVYLTAPERTAEASLGARPSSAPPCDPGVLPGLMALVPLDPDIAPASIVEVGVERSSIKGRVDIVVVTRHEAGEFFQSIDVEGRYGKVDDGDVLPMTWDERGYYRDFISVPEAGDCGIWERRQPVREVQPTTNRWKFLGLWGEEEYCFLVTTAVSEEALLSSASARVLECVRASWDTTWGPISWPERPLE